MLTGRPGASGIVHHIVHHIVPNIVPRIILYQEGHHHPPNLPIAVLVIFDTLPDVPNCVPTIPHIRMGQQTVTPATTSICNHYTQMPSKRTSGIAAGCTFVAIAISRLPSLQCGLIGLIPFQRKLYLVETKHIAINHYYF